jgi:hypothetical protein
MPSKLLAKVDIVEGIVDSTVNTQLSDLAGFFLFLYSFFLCFPCPSLF